VDTWLDLEGCLGYGEGVRFDLMEAVARGRLEDLITYAETGPGAYPNPTTGDLLEVLDDAEQEVDDYKVDDYKVDSPEVVAGIAALRAQLAPAVLPAAA
jgi:hypothetical protein